MINQIISQLKSQRSSLEQAIAHLSQAIRALEQEPGKAPAAASQPKAAKHTMSAASRARIVAAQKKRWAAFHAAKAKK